jgi:hypothetical protein
VDAQSTATRLVRGRIRAHIARSRTSWAKNTEKIAEKLAENGGQWRLSEGPKRHFAVFRVDRECLQDGRLPNLPFTESACRGLRLARQIVSGRHFSRVAARERHM